MEVLKSGRKNIKGEENANKVHFNMGRDIRNFIESHGGTTPEKLPTPKKSLKELEKEKNIKLIDK